MQPPDFGDAPRRPRERFLESEERFQSLEEGIKDYSTFMFDVEVTSAP
jgi:hypothetical protein